MRLAPASCILNDAMLAPLDQPPTCESLTDIAVAMRLHLLEMHHRSRAAHLGSAMSCVDILSVLYWRVLRIDPAQPDAPDRDRFILSKGHAASALYTTLALRGFFGIEELAAFGRSGSRLPEQPTPRLLPGVEAATGSLGHGLPIAVGLAKASKLHRDDARVYVLLSDGECNEGSVWEAAMFAAAHKLNNLTVIIDHNGWQATARTKDVLALSPLDDKWRSFGFDVAETNGHDMAALERTLTPGAQDTTRPRAVIAHTIKGKGVSFMEDDNNWHYRAPNDDELASARRELLEKSDSH